MSYLWSQFLAHQVVPLLATYDTKCSLMPSWALLIAQVPSSDISPFSWALKFNPAKILAGQSELRSCIIVLKQPKALENE